MIILHATAEGNTAVRHPLTGTSYFIQELCQQLRRRERRTIYQESLTKILSAQSLRSRLGKQFLDIISSKRD